MCANGISVYVCMYVCRIYLFIVNSVFIYFCRLYMYVHILKLCLQDLSIYICMYVCMYRNEKFSM